MKPTRLLLVALICGALGAKAQKVSNYTLSDIDNNQVSLNELKGEHLTILDFWTTWCKPCKKSIPQLISIYDDYKDLGVQVIGVNCDGPRSVAKVPGVSRSMEINYPVLIDINSDIANSLNIGSFPTLVILDKEQRIKYYHDGFIPGDEEEIREVLNKLLK